jgi:hypothetical protein
VCARVAEAPNQAVQAGAGLRTEDGGWRAEGLSEGLRLRDRCTRPKAPGVTQPSARSPRTEHAPREVKALDLGATSSAPEATGRQRQ